MEMCECGSRPIISNSVQLINELQVLVQKMDIGLNATDRNFLSFDLLFRSLCNGHVSNDYAQTGEIN